MKMAFSTRGVPALMCAVPILPGVLAHLARPRDRIGETVLERAAATDEVTAEAKGEVTEAKGQQIAETTDERTAEGIGDRTAEMKG